MTDAKRLPARAVDRKKSGVGEDADWPCELKKPDEPWTFIIFGASGDLTARKLIPALYKLYKGGCLPYPFTILGVARSEMDTDGFRKNLKRSMQTRSGLSLGVWPDFEHHIFYKKLETDQPDAYRELEKEWRRLDEERGTLGNRIIYLATPPSAYGSIVEKIGSAGISDQLERGPGWSRIIVEKPFGFDSGSAERLNDQLAEAFDENRIFRIDPHLTGETIQNLLLFRFANIIFKEAWNNRCIDQVRIIAADSLGVENRGDFYEQAGVLRDMFLTNMLQVLAMCAMEPPESLDADSVWTEMTRVFKSLTPINQDSLNDSLLLGQYTGGWVRGTPVPGYRNENEVAKDSLTPTFALMKVFLDNDRWRGVPFYLISGKRLPKKETRIIIRFKSVSHSMFQDVLPARREPNTLIIGVQPDETIELTFQTKLPGGEICLRPVGVSFNYLQGYDGPVPDTYEKALMDCMTGDHMIFWRRDGLEASWAFLTPIIEACAKHPDPSSLIKLYEAGTWGPNDAARMLDDPEWGE